MSGGNTARVAAADRASLVQRLAGYSLGCVLRSLDLGGHTPAQRSLLLEAMNALDDIEAIIETANGTDDTLGDAPYDTDAPTPGHGRSPGRSQSLLA